MIDAAAADYAEIEGRTRQLAESFVTLTADLCLVLVPSGSAPYDKTLLLLLGQRRTAMAVVVDGDTVTFAAGFDSGINFLECLGLSGGMPTRVSVRRPRLAEALSSLGVPSSELSKAGL
jgi:hypothetical protein